MTRRGRGNPGNSGADDCPWGVNGKHARGTSGCGCSRDPEVIAANRARAGLPPKDDKKGEGKSGHGHSQPRGKLRTCNAVYAATLSETKEHNRLYGHTKHWCLERWFEPGVHSRHKCARPGCSFTW